MKAYAFPLVNGGHGRAFFGLLLITPLEHWGVEKWGIAHITFDYLNIISAYFHPNPCSHLAGYVHIYIYIYIASSISIRLPRLEFVVNFYM